ncbi:spermine oxidase-like [Cylas formicarius]|uniref:spermine oxidase-like n=1 Tax=Cylas formicarius TaxID=197179 RepID=UPI00295886DD|nr:spermine oxidase-like [Cylas formicarius]
MCIPFLLILSYCSLSWAQEHPSVLIVGSGPAGVAAATKLLKNNFTNVKILEAENRIGGRIHSLKFGDAYVDLGAEYCHGEEGNVVYSMVKDLNVLVHPKPNVTVLSSNGEEVNRTVVDKVLRLVYFLGGSQPDDETQKDCENALSLGECVDSRYEKWTENADNDKLVLKDLKSWTENCILSYDSSFDTHDSLYKADFKSCDGDNGMHWDGHGYKTILDVMMQKFPDPRQQLPIDDKVLLGKEVTGITKWKTGGMVQISCSDGSVYFADHVIFSPSVGVLKADHSKMFQPSLPEEKISAINNIGFGSVVKVFFHYPERVNRFGGVLCIVQNSKDLQEVTGVNEVLLSNVVCILDVDHNPNVLVAWFAGKNVTAIESLNNDQIMEAQKYWTKNIFGPKFNIGLPDKILKSTWYTNPHFRGTYSYASVKGHSKGGGGFPSSLATPLVDDDGVPRVLFAGEATHPHFYSTVHGAIETGYREAERILKLYNID